MTDNYIGVKVSDHPISVFKLFDRHSGKYLRDIGHQGRGPNEYLNIYSAAIDEATDAVYRNTDKLLVFGIDGTHKEPIRLPRHASKAIFSLNADGTVNVASLPMRTAVWAWTQDRDGFVVSYLRNSATGQHIDYSSEIEVGLNTGEFDPFMNIFDKRFSDTLGSFDIGAGRLRPLFTIKNIMTKKPPYYSYGQMPLYFYGTYEQGMEQVDEITFESRGTVRFVVDKQTLQGAFFDLTIDELGGLEDEWPSFSQGYYVRNFAAIHLKKQLEELIAAGTIADPAILKRVTELNDFLSDEDNNIILFGKLKR